MTDLKTALQETAITVELITEKGHHWVVLPLEHAQALLAALQPTEVPLYDPEQACKDCPIGGRDGSGPVCPNAAACDHEAREFMEAMERDAG